MSFRTIAASILAVGAALLASPGHAYAMMEDELCPMHMAMEADHQTGQTAFAAPDAALAALDTSDTRQIPHPQATVFSRIVLMKTCPHKHGGNGETTICNDCCCCVGPAPQHGAINGSASADGMTASPVGLALCATLALSPATGKLTFISQVFSPDTPPPNL